MQGDGTAESVTLGDIEFQGKDINTPEVKFDKIAVSGRDELLMVSLVADTQRVKQIRAILCGGVKAVAQASGVKIKQPGASGYAARTPGRLHPSPDGYTCYTHRLGYGYAHALFITRTPGFMKVVSPESLWQELKSTRFTTPLLKEWMPHVEEMLRIGGDLVEAEVYNCSCGLLTATTKKLDEIVTEGLKQRIIEIPRSVA